MMKNITNIQNKICSFNILMNRRIVNTTPILFRIHESGNKNIADILYEHIDKILKVVYAQAISIQDLMDVTIYGVAYDILSDNDLCDSYDIDISDKINYDNEVVIELVINKINEYSQLVLDKIKVNEKCESFVDAFNKINEANDSKITTDTFTQYIISCFKEEYKSNKFDNAILNIMNKKFNDINNK